MPEKNPHPASFRDPSGFIFMWEGKYYRQVNTSYGSDYELLMNSGLYDHLTEKKILLSHTETNEIIARQNSWHKTLEPTQVPYITYPYEWCFAQFRDAALLTLSMVKISIEYGMIIKDATPFNVQFIDGNAVFIDTLSFEKYDAEKPWVAYRQFCNMFLFPLYLEYYLRTDIQKIMIAYPDGIPVDITSRLLPLKSSLSLGVWLHVYLQNTVTQNTRSKTDGDKFSKKKLLNLVNHLEATIQKLNSRMSRTEWSNYYESTIPGKNYLQEKEKVFREMISKMNIKTALDLGANDGYFSKILAEENTEVIAVDSDSRTISKLYNELKAGSIKNILPLVMDVANPSPSIGFRNRERPSFHQRIKTELVIALALVHHLVIGRNISLTVLAEYFSEITELLLIEWIPREDEKVMQMLSGRKDVFGDYTADHFEHSFSRFFHVKKKEKIPGCHRILYLMEKR
jgi:hypothetical protein